LGSFFSKSPDTIKLWSVPVELWTGDVSGLFEKDLRISHFDFSFFFGLAHVML
jgi:hypothetical protein